MGWPTQFDHVFSKLEGLKGGTSNQWSAFCPSHLDHHQSLSIRIGDNGAVLMRCHAPHGCTLASIVAKLGIKTESLFPDWRQGMSDRKIVATYDYRDEKNTLLFQTIRWEPKGFCQRKPNQSYDPKKPKSKEANPEWIYTIDGVRRVPYKLPHLLSLLSANKERLVLIVEGEKDVDLAMKHGIAATCNPMGAGKWDKSFNQHLQGCNVVVIPDEDPIDEKTGFSPGCRHAEEICASLHGVAKTLKVVRLQGVPPKGDLSDWWISSLSGMASDEVKNTLRELIRVAKVWQPGDRVIPVEFVKNLTDSKIDPEPTAQAKEASVVSSEPAWDGEISPALQRIAEVVVEMKETIRTSDLVQINARMQIEVGRISAMTVLSEKPVNNELRDTFAAIAAYAVRGMEELEKAHKK